MIIGNFIQRLVSLNGGNQRYHTKHVEGVLTVAVASIIQLGIVYN